MRRSSSLCVSVSVRLDRSVALSVSKSVRCLFRLCPGGVRRSSAASRRPRLANLLLRCRCRTSFAVHFRRSRGCCVYICSLQSLRPADPAMRPHVTRFVSSPRTSSPRDASCRLSISPAPRAPRRFVIRSLLSALTSTCAPPAPPPPRPRGALRRPPLRVSPDPLPQQPALLRFASLLHRRRPTRRPVTQQRAHHYPPTPLRRRDAPMAAPSGAAARAPLSAGADASILADRSVRRALSRRLWRAR